MTDETPTNTSTGIFDKLKGIYTAIREHRLLTVAFWTAVGGGIILLAQGLGYINILK